MSDDIVEWEDVRWTVKVMFIAATLVVTTAMSVVVVGALAALVKVWVKVVVWVWTL